MPSVITWTTARDALGTALAHVSLAADAPAKLYGQGLLARLNATGAAYDADNARLRTTVDADDATYSAALTTWTTAMGPVWTRATNLCRYLEAAQVAYQSSYGTTLTPRIAETTRGPIVLGEHTVPFPDPFTDPSPARAWDTILDGGGAPVARIEARELGIAGGRVSVEVAAASDGDATHRKVILRLGSYSEVYDDLDFTAEGGTGAQDESLLVLPFVHLKRAVPEIRSALTLGNSAGGVLDAVRNRLLGLAALPVGEGALRAVEVDLLRETVLDLERAWAEKPTLRNVLAQREAELAAVMTDAQRLTSFLGSGLAW
jgi:hypothetical protein